MADIAKDTLIGRIAAELIDLSAQTTAIEAALSGFDATGGHARTVLQELDRMRQTQLCLATCLEAIADAASEESLVPFTILDAGGVLPSVAERLRTGTRAADSLSHTIEPEIW